jgi:hypothetical protein
MEITCRKKVPRENILVGNLFLTLISRGAQGKHIFYISFKKKKLLVDVRAI